MHVKVMVFETLPIKSELLLGYHCLVSRVVTVTAYKPDMQIHSEMCRVSLQYQIHYPDCPPPPYVHSSEGEPISYWARLFRSQRRDPVRVYVVIST